MIGECAVECWDPRTVPHILVIGERSRHQVERYAAAIGARIEIGPVGAIETVTDLRCRVHTALTTAGVSRMTAVVIANLPEVVLETSMSTVSSDLAWIGRFGHYAGLHLVCGASDEGSCAVIPLSLSNMFGVTYPERF